MNDFMLGRREGNEGTIAGQEGGDVLFEEGIGTGGTPEVWGVILGEETILDVD